MKKYILFLFLLTIPLLKISSQELNFQTGGTARNISLGGGPVNPYLDDVLRLHINPALSVFYKDVLWGDVGFINTDPQFGSGRTQYLGLLLNITNNATAGLIINHRKSPLYNSDPSNPSLDPVRILNSLTYSVLGFGSRQFDRPQTPLEVVIAHKYSIFNLGFSFTYAQWKYDATSPARTLKLKSNFMKFKLGTIFDLSESFQFDGAVLLTLNDMNGEIVPSGFQKNELQLDGGTEFEFDSKFKFQVNQKLKLIPILKWYWFQWGPYVSIQNVKPVPNPPVKFTNSIFEVGLGFNYQINRIFIVGGLSFQSISFDQDGRYTNVQDVVIKKITDLPKINLGAEIKITEWLWGRIGYFDRLSTYETNEITASGEFPWYGDPNGMSLDQQRITIGIGIKFSKFSFDCTIGEGLFLRGPWLLSGIQQPMFSIVSMSYIF